MANPHSVPNDDINGGVTSQPSEPDIKSRPTSTTFEIEIFGSPNDGDVSASISDEKEFAEDRQKKERSTIICIAVVIIVIVFVIVGLITYFTVTTIKQHGATSGNSSTPSPSDIVSAVKRHSASSGCYVSTPNISDIVTTMSHHSTPFGNVPTPNQSDLEDMGGECPVIISRAKWGARSAVDIEPLSTPTPYAVIHHTATQACESTDACKSAVRGIQNFHMDTNGWWDIGYNFLIGGDGNVYEGRGWDRKGAHARSYNQYSIGIAVIGDYMTFLPSQAALATLNTFTDCLRNQSKLDPCYALYGHRQAVNTLCPGDELYKHLQDHPHWRYDNNSVANPNPVVSCTL